MADFDIDVSQVRALAAELNRATGQVGAQAAQVVRKTALDIVGDAKILAPVDTGFLEGSISADFTGDGRHGEMSAAVGPTASYSAYVELGTSKMAPQPFLFPAADRHEPNFYAAMAQIGGSIL